MIAKQSLHPFCLAGLSILAACSNDADPGDTAGGSLTSTAGATASAMQSGAETSTPPGAGGTAGAHAADVSSGPGGTSPEPTPGAGAGGGEGSTLNGGSGGGDVGESGAETASGGETTDGRAGGGSGNAAGTDSGTDPLTAGSGGLQNSAGAGTDSGGSGGSGAMAGAGGAFTGTCTESQPANRRVTTSGPHEVVIETNSEPGINEGTIFRPADLGGDEKYPIFVWGQGACSGDGFANVDAMAEIASHGYFIVADGTPSGGASRPMNGDDLEGMGAPLIAYIDWAIAENSKPCSAYYQSLETSKVSSNGFSCGGLMSQGTAHDPRLTTWGLTSSGMANTNPVLYDWVDTPVLFVEGGPSDSAYDGGGAGYERIAALGVPVMWFSKDLGHGGDMFQPGGGDFTKLNLAWLNWWLKGDESATGKGLLVGADCTYCTDSSWEVMSDNIP